MARFTENRWTSAIIPALLIHIPIGTVHCWSVFKQLIADRLHASPASVEWGFSLAIFFLGMSAAFAGPMVEKNIKKSALVSMVCFVVGFAGTGVSIALNFLPGVFICYGAIMGIGLGVGYLTPVKNLMLWFADNKGLATGIAVAGFGLAKAIASPLMEYLIGTVGLVSMFFILAAVYAVMMFVGFLLIKAGGALIDNMAWLFAIGAAVGLADNDGTAGLAGLVSFLMMQQLLNPGVVSAVRHIEEGTATYIAYQKVAGNSFIGILAAVIGAACYNKFKDTQLPDWLAFFSGKRFVAIATGLISIVASVVLLFVWPVIFDALVAIGNGIAGMDGIGAGIYAFLNRLLIPTGLHHALNNVFWFDTIGLGDLTHFWAGETSADVGWSLGMYMSGFFPCMMFGIAGAALAMVKTAKNKKAAIGLVVSAAICAFVCGVTEPFEFGFMFLCFPLYVVYSALYGIFTIITYYSGFRAGFCFSAGATDLVFSASLPAAAKTWMIIPLGIAAFLVFYFVFYFAITKFDLKTPGREDDDEEAEKKVVLANNNYTEVASAVLAAVGGKENVKDVGYCATRLRFEVKDNAKVDEKAVKAAGAAGVIRPSKNACQVIIGTKVQFVYDELKKML